MSFRYLLRHVATSLVLLSFLFAAAGLNVTASAVAVLPASHAVRADARVGSKYQRLGPVSNKAQADALIFNCQTSTTNRCYIPQQIRAAYNIQPLLDAGITGAGRTIVIVDAFGNPDIQKELTLFDATFGLPDPTLQVVYPFGSVPFDYNDPNQVGWSGEIALDVQWAHAVAPAAKIVLVVARTNDDQDILNATKWAVDNNIGDVISQSFGEGETCVDPAIERAQHQMFREATAKHITLFASSGDQGAAQPTCDGSSYFLSASSPASDPLVTGVGGTKLLADANTGAYISEIASDEEENTFGTGGGFSTIYHKPSYQRGVSTIPTNQRGVPDVAYNMALNGGVIAVWSFDGVNFYYFIFGGTSSGSPQWAGIAALADQKANRRLGFLNRAIYAIGKNSSLYPQVFHDITSGSNPYDDLVPGYNAGPGWDATTGWGTPKVNKLIPALIDYTSSSITDFNLFVLNDLNFTQGGGTIEGKIGVGGNLTMSSASLGSGGGDELVVNGNVTFSNGGTIKGNLLYGGSAHLDNFTFVNGQAKHTSNPLKLSPADYVSGISDSWAALSANGTTKVQYNGITLTGHDAYRNVFSVKGNDLSSATSLQVNVPAGSDVVINVSGTSVKMQNLGIWGADSHHTVYNFYQATNLTVGGATVPGAVWGAKADVKFSNGNLQGSLVGKSVSGGGSFQYSSFIGDLP